MIVVLCHSSSIQRWRGGRQTYLTEDSSIIGIPRASYTHSRMREWEQQLNHAGQRPIRSFPLSLFSSILSPSASTRLYTTARLPSTSHQVCTPTEVSGTAKRSLELRRRMGEARKSLPNVQRVDGCRWTPVGVAPAKGPFQRVPIYTVVSSTRLCSFIPRANFVSVSGC